jgi:hypothetical protein
MGDIIKKIQFFIIYVPRPQLQGRLQTQQSVDTSNRIKEEHKIKKREKITGLHWRKKHINTEKVNSQKQR